MPKGKGTYGSKRGRPKFTTNPEIKMPNYQQLANERKKKEREFLMKYRRMILAGLIPKLSASKPKKFRR